jgi:murein DD-endopeptidase MepM/ murein hydrolase activator NlpD
MSKGGRIVCIVLAVLLAASAAFAIRERSRTDSLGAELLKEQTAAKEEISGLKAQIEELTRKLEEAYVAPRVTFSGSEFLQGDILTVHVEMNSAKGTPEIETDLGKPVFIEDPDGGGVAADTADTGAQSAVYTAYVPVGFAQTPGDYTVSVTADGRDYTGTVTVSARSYGEQHMTMSSATASATIGADNANEDYAQKVTPTYYTAEPQRYWEGTFIQPVTGPVTTQFGLYRYTTYTDGTSRKVVRHTGVDIGAAKGTPVPATNAGKVIYAGDVIITGGTIVIDHGGGLKSYYFHLSSVDCAAGDIVKKGDIIGKVGATGYATGAHLHFELKIGEYSLSPWALWDGTSDLYK